MDITFNRQMRVAEVNHGDHFSCRIQGRSVTGRINKEHTDNAILLCNNAKNGRFRPAELFGKDGCWAVPIARGVLDFAGGNVTDFVITKRATRATPKVAAPRKAATVQVQSVVETPSERIARLRRELAAEEQAENERTRGLGSFKEWRITRSTNGLFTFGCGEVQLSRTELENWLTVQRHLIRRGYISINGLGARVDPAANRKNIVDTINQGLETVERILRVTR